MGHVPVPAAQNLGAMEMAAQQTYGRSPRSRARVTPRSSLKKFEDITEDTPDMLREGYDYYRTPRGAHPKSKGRFLLTSMDKMFAFSSFDQIPDFLTQPMLLIAGSKADTKIFSDRGVCALQRPQGAVRRRWRDTHRHVRRSRVRRPGRRPDRPSSTARNLA